MYSFVVGLLILISILFILWMIFLDTHSLKIHLDLNNEIEKLENEKKELTLSLIHI